MLVDSVESPSTALSGFVSTAGAIDVRGQQTLYLSCVASSDARA